MTQSYRACKMVASCTVCRSIWNQFIIPDAFVFAEKREGRWRYSLGDDRKMGLTQRRG